MALMVPGPAASILSGKLGGVVFSRNKGGSYARSYAIPSIVTSQRALDVKSTLAAISQAWSIRSAADRLAWNAFAAMQPVTNRIGQQTLLSGQAWHNGLNARLILAGEDANAAPPVHPSPVAVGLSAPTVDVNGTEASITFSAHPDTTSVRAIIYGARTTSAARTYVRNKYTHIVTTAPNPSGVEDFGTELAAALGTLQEGITYHFKVCWLDIRTGRISAEAFLSTVAVDTTP